MAIAHDFQYERPQGLNQILTLLDEYRNRCRILAGGTDLIVNIKEGAVKPELLIDIKDIPELRHLGMSGASFHIGAGVTFADLIEASEIRDSFPVLWDAAKTVASTGVRSRATLSGNICSAVPSLDSGPALLCYDAVIHLASLSGTRDLPVSEWFLAPRKTALADNELVTGISLAIPAERSAGIYLKLGRYGGEDLAQAGWGFTISLSRQYRIAHCALAPIPRRARLIEDLLRGQALTSQIIEQAVALLPREVAPITDIRSSKEYRLHMCSVMLRRGLMAAQDRLDGKDIDPKMLLGGLN